MNRNIKTQITREESRMERFTQARNLEFGIGVAADPAAACGLYRALYEKERKANWNLILDEFPERYWESLAPETAFRYLEKSARIHDERSMEKLARCYELGECVPQDAAEAVRWYRMAADIGREEAQYKLGCFYWEGTLLPRDTREAVRLFRFAAEQEHKRAHYRLALCYDNGAEDFPADATMAARYYRRALLERYRYLYECIPYFSPSKSGRDSADRYLPELERDNWSAALCYAACCERGEGTAKKMHEALKWYRAAAEWGGWLPIKAMFQFLERHPGIDMDESEKARRSLNAAWLYSSEARFDIARRYELGIGVPCNLYEAAYWYNRAGWDCLLHTKATKAWERIARKIGRDSLPPRNQPPPSLLLRMDLAQAGDADAQYVLGTEYDYGTFVERDLVKSVYWFRLAAAQGHAKAKEKLKRRGIAWGN